MEQGLSAMTRTAHLDPTDGRGRGHFLAMSEDLQYVVNSREEFMDLWQCLGIETLKTKEFEGQACIYRLNREKNNE